MMWVVSSRFKANIFSGRKFQFIWFFLWNRQSSPSCQFILSCFKFASQLACILRLPPQTSPIPHILVSDQNPDACGWLGPTWKSKMKTLLKNPPPENIFPNLRSGKISARCPQVLDCEIVEKMRLSVLVNFPPALYQCCPRSNSSVPVAVFPFPY